LEGSLLQFVAVCCGYVAVSPENVMSHFPKDFEDLDPKTAISTNVCGYVAVAEVQKHQCLCGL
jgi:hypothetical protein